MRQFDEFSLLFFTRQDGALACEGIAAKDKIDMFTCLMHIIRPGKTSAVRHQALVLLHRSKYK